MANLLAEMSSAELTAWIEYLRIDDEVRAQWMAYAIIKARENSVQQQQTTPHRAGSEEIIDTTDPQFTKLFQGFSYEKPRQAMPQRHNRQTSTEIKIG